MKLYHASDIKWKSDLTDELKLPEQAFVYASSEYTVANVLTARYGATIKDLNTELVKNPAVLNLV